MNQPTSILRLVNKLCSLPGVGAKTALRYAYYIIGLETAEAEEFCTAIMDVKQKIKLCSKCGGLSETEVCPICSVRDDSVLCVVAYPKDISIIERAGFRGGYHVLNGTLSPLDGRGPEQLRIKELLSRLEKTTEVITAFNPDTEGEATCNYLARLIKPLGITVSRLAQGISSGSDIEYTDENTISRAIEGRTKL